MPNGVPQELVTVAVLAVTELRPILVVCRNTLPIVEAEVSHVPVMPFVRSLVAMLSHAVSRMVILS